MDHCVYKKKSDDVYLNHHHEEEFISHCFLWTLWCKWLSSCLCSTKDRFVQCSTSSCWITGSRYHPQSPWASLISALPACPGSGGARLSLGRFSVVPHSFHFQMMDWAVLHQMFKAREILVESNRALNASTTSSPTCLMCSLDFMMLFAHQYSLKKHWDHHRRAASLVFLD